MSGTNEPNDSEYRDYVLAAIRAGLEDVKNGRLLDQAEVEKRMSRWLREDEESDA
jgi:predicted transcriptional regulator